MLFTWGCSTVEELSGSGALFDNPTNSTTTAISLFAAHFCVAGHLQHAVGSISSTGFPTADSTIALPKTSDIL